MCRLHPQASKPAAKLTLAALSSFHHAKLLLVREPRLAPSPASAVGNRIDVAADARSHAADAQYYLAYCGLQNRAPPFTPIWLLSLNRPSPIPANLNRRRQGIIESSFNRLQTVNNQESSPHSGQGSPGDGHSASRSSDHDARSSSAPADTLILDLMLS